MCVALVFVVIGCGDYRAGDRYGISGAAVIYLDESLFKNVIELKKAKKGLPSDEILRNPAIVYLGDGVEVTIVEPVAGGAKVKVTSGRERTKVGWMLSADLATANPRK
jgi:hypothetical protein